MGNFIKQIQIEKIRHLQNLTIDITENERKHLIITGKNGSGKTTLLGIKLKFNYLIRN